MQLRNLIIFRNYSGFDESIIKSGLGELSLRNLIVFSIFGGISFVMFKLLIPINFEITDNPILVILILIPVIIGIILVFVKPKFGSADSNILSLVCMYQRNKNNKRNTTDISKTKSEKSKVLGFGKILNPQNPTEENKVREFTCSDFSEIKSLKITLYETNGKIFSNKLVKCYIDNHLIDTLRTSLDGVLVIKIKPEKEGKKKLVIKSNDDKILLQQFLYFKKK